MIKEDYSQLVLPIHGLEVTDIVKNFRQLNRHEEFNAYPLEKKRDRVIKCINYLYSAKSPLIKLYKDDLMMRKEEAAILAGFNPKDRKEWEWVTETIFMFKGESDSTTAERSDKILNMVIRFFIMQNNMTWNNICTSEQIYYQNIFQINRSLNEAEKDKDIIAAQEKKSVLSKQNIQITLDLDGLYDKFFSQAEDVKDLYKKREEVRLNFTSPENVAMMPQYERPEVTIK